MNFKRIRTSAIALLLVVCILVNCCPVKAEAAAATAVVTGVTTSYILPLIGATLVALGVAAVADTTDFDTIASNCQTWIQDNTDYILGDTVGIVEVAYGTDTQYFISEEWIQAVRDWLFSSCTVYESVSSAISGVAGDGLTYSDYDTGNLWVKSLDLISLASAASAGQGTVLSGNAINIANCSAFGAAFRTYAYHYGLDCLLLKDVYSFGSWTSTTFPVGQFVDGFDTETTFSNEYIVFLNYSDAEKVYRGIANGDFTSSGNYVWYLNDDSYLSFYRYGTNYSKYIFVYNAGYININTGVVSTGTFSKSTSAVYPLTPLGLTTDEVISVNSDYNVSLGSIAASDVSIPVGYEDWASGAISVPSGTTVSGFSDDDDYYPVVLPEDLASIYDLSQEEAQANTISEGEYAGSETATDAVTATGLKGWLDSLSDRLSSLLLKLQLGLSNLLDSVKEGFSNLIGYLSQLPMMIGAVFRLLAEHFGMLAAIWAVITFVPEYISALFSWMPEEIFAIIVVIFVIVGVYKLIGREG